MTRVSVFGLWSNGWRGVILCTDERMDQAVEVAKS